MYNLANARAAYNWSILLPPMYLPVISEVRCFVDEFVWKFIVRASFEVLRHVGYCRRLDSAIQLNWVEIAPTLAVGAFLKKRPKSSAALNGFSAPTHSVLHPSIVPDRSALKWTRPAVLVT